LLRTYKMKDLLISSWSTAINSCLLISIFIMQPSSLIFNSQISSISSKNSLVISQNTMLMPQVHQSLYPSRTSLILPKPCIYGNSRETFLVPSRSSFTKTRRNERVVYKTSNNIKAMSTASTEQPPKLKATVSTVVKGTRSDRPGKILSLELVFADLDPSKWSSGYSIFINFCPIY